MAYVWTPQPEPGTAGLVKTCIDSFATLSTQAYGDERFSEQVVDEFGRFRIWAGNLCAQAIGPESLQYRLRNSQELSLAVSHSLTNLVKALQSITASKTATDLQSGDSSGTGGHKGNDDSDSDNDSGGDGDAEGDDALFGTIAFDDPSEDVLAEVSDIISHLLRISMVLGTPAHSDRTRYPEITPSEEIDMKLVQTNFAGASAKIVQRLGRCVSKQRQYLAYKKRFHEEPIANVEKREQNEALSSTTTVSTISQLFLPHLLPSQALPASVDDSTLTKFGELPLQRPPPSSTAPDEVPVRCRLCRCTLFARDQGSCIQHVYDDLMPYICLYEECTIPARRYATQIEWRNHMEGHEKQYICPFDCAAQHGSNEEFCRHLMSQHAVSATMASDFSKSCTMKSTAEAHQACPLCKLTHLDFPSPDRWYEHIGHHLEQLALFAIPSHLLLQQSNDDLGDDKSSHERRQSSSKAPPKSDDLDFSSNPCTANLEALDLAGHSDLIKFEGISSSKFVPVEFALSKVVHLARTYRSPVHGLAIVTAASTRHSSSVTVLADEMDKHCRHTSDLGPRHSQRKKKAPRRRIVEFLQAEIPPPPQLRICDPSDDDDDDDEESSPTRSLQDVIDGASTSTDIYKQKIETLKSELGPNWITALNDDCFSEERLRNRSYSLVSQSSTVRPDAQRGVSMGRRTLG